MFGLGEPERPVAETDGIGVANHLNPLLGKPGAASDVGDGLTADQRRAGTFGYVCRVESMVEVSVHRHHRRRPPPAEP